MSGSLPQLQTFQLPDVGGVVNALQGLELNRMRSQQLQGAEQERNNLRAVFADPNFNPSSPDAAARILRAAPNTGAQVFNALTAGQREQRQAQAAQSEAELKAFDLSREALRGIAELPEADRPAAWAAWRTRTEATVPWARGFIPAQYSPAAYTSMISKASDIATGLRPRTPVVTQVQGMPPFLTDPITGITRPATEAGAPPPAAPGAPAPRAAAPGLTPGQAAAADFLRRREGFRDTPYYDVNAYRAGFGSDTTTLPDGTVVPVRQGMTVSREDAERDLARRVPEFTQRAAAAIGEERFAALPPNAQAALISIAYNYGTLPGRIREAARSGDLAALSQAVAGLAGDNQGVNAGRRREEATMIAGGNAMAPGAAPANAMLAPADAMVRSDVPQLPLDPSAGPLARADYQKRMLDAIQQLEVKRIDAERARADQPGRVQEAGQTVGAQEAARIQAREAEARRAETEKLNTAIRELERISRPGGLLERSTGSGVGRLVDIAGEFIGVSSRGAQAAAALAPIADVVLKMVPRFEGPQSDKDTATYQAAAGRLADPTVPNETRLAAAREIVRLMRDRRGQFSYAAGGAAAPTAAPAAPAAPPVPQGLGMTPDNWSRLWGVMTPQERALWQN